MLCEDCVKWRLRGTMVSGEISIIRQKPGTLNWGSKKDVLRAFGELDRPHVLQAQWYETDVTETQM